MSDIGLMSTRSLWITDIYEVQYRLRTTNALVLAPQLSAVFSSFQLSSILAFIMCAMAESVARAVARGAGLIELKEGM